MGRRFISLGACLALTLMVLLPISASAHPSLKRGKYACWEWISYEEMWPTPFDVKIKSSTRYVLIMNGDEPFGGGKFVHDGQKLRFKSGHLHKKKWKGTHSVDGSGTHGIKLTRTSNDGVTIISTYYCSN